MAKTKKQAATKRASMKPVETPVIGWTTSQEEYDARVGRVVEHLERRKLNGLVLFHPIRMAYVSGFFHLSTERPMAIVVTADGQLGALIPHLEAEHIGKSRNVTAVKIYPEYPTGGTKHPMLHLADLLKEMKLNGKGKRLGYDSNGYLDVNGYNGPSLTEVLAGWVETENARDLVDRLRAVKSAQEIHFLTESCVWGNLAHRLMHDLMEVGRSPMDIWIEASAEASQMMVAALGPGYQPQTTVFGTPASAQFTAGANTSMPHGLSTGAGLRPGDVLVTYAGADVGGYQSELERTMLMGEPSKAFAQHFEVMLQLQQAGFNALKPGRSFADVERDVVRVFEELGVSEHQRHHTGHGLGLEGHEWPFIDLGAEDELVQEHMVLSVEPGLYVPGLAGFRHSDTVVVRSHGAERLTFYPRDLESLTVPV